MTRAIIRRLANLSLQDYKWRSDYFKKSEADRRVEESLARMIGDDPSYFRPMDASDSTIGPLVRSTYVSHVVFWGGKRFLPFPTFIIIIIMIR